MSLHTLKVNGRSHDVDADPDTPLLYVLSDDLDLRGPKFGCGLGQCGACTVVIERTGDEILRDPGERGGTARDHHARGARHSESPHPIQEAFIAEQAAQCGFCLSGVILTAKAFLDANPRATDEQIQQALSGVLCRCFGNGRMLKAIRRYANARTA